VVGEDPAIEHAGVGVEPRRAAGRDQRSGHGVPSQCLLPGGERTRGEGEGAMGGGTEKLIESTVSASSQLFRFRLAVD
jgi:hypothetical protein